MTPISNDIASITIPHVSYGMKVALLYLLAYCPMGSAIRLFYAFFGEIGLEWRWGTGPGIRTQWFLAPETTSEMNQVSLGPNDRTVVDKSPSRLSQDDP